MPANTKQLKCDVDKKPSPQYFDPVLDEYGYLYGSNGASRHILYGADGNPISTTGDKLAVRATEIETQLTTIQDYIDGIEATLATLATIEGQAALIGHVDQLEAQLTIIQGYIDGLEGAIGQAVASPAANSLLARVKNLEDKLAVIIADGLKLSGSYVEIGGVSFAVSGGDTLRGKSADKPDAVAAHAVIPYCFYFSIDTGAIEVTDGTNWGVI
ncbi:hypothetical protein ACU70A_06315 [Syntrophomonas erecta subsp. sporosyntropha]